MQLIAVSDFVTSVIAICTTKNVRQVATDFRSCISCCRRFSHAHEDVATDFPKCCQHIFARTEIYWHRAVLVLDLEASRRPSTLATIPNERLRKKTRKLGMGRGSEEGGASLPYRFSSVVTPDYSCRDDGCARRDDWTWCGRGALDASKLVR